jgi:hypothetical protein
MLFVLFLAIAMGIDLILWKPQSVPNSVVLGQYCKIYWNKFSQLEFFAASVLSSMATKKINVIVSKERFESLLRYYVKMNLGQFVEHSVTPKLYHELFEQTQTTQVPLLLGEKDHHNFQCIYCGGE